MRLIRILVALLALMTVVTPTLASACASAAVAGHGVVAMEHDSDHAAMSDCHGMKPAPAEQPTHDWIDACSMAATCHFAAGAALMGSIANLPVEMGNRPIVFVASAIPSITLPPPIEPPIA